MGNILFVKQQDNIQVGTEIIFLNLLKMPILNILKLQNKQ
jgi:hypothetical protein